MTSSARRQLKTPEQIEHDLLEDLRQKRLDWKHSSGKDQELARQLFMDALDLFKSFYHLRQIDDALDCAANNLRTRT